MPEYLTPGVYVEEVSFRAPSIQGVGTSTAAFAGVTLTGPTDGTPELLTSFGDYQNIYGGFDNLKITGVLAEKNTNYMALSVKAFFDNGGSRVYVSRVIAQGAGVAKGVATSAGGSPHSGNIVATAMFPGSYLNNQIVTATLTAVKTQKPDGLPSGSLLALSSGSPATHTLYWNGTGSTFVDANSKQLNLQSGDTLYVLTLRVTAPGAAPGSALVYDGLGFDPAHSRHLGSVLSKKPPRRRDALQNQIYFDLDPSLTPPTAKNPLALFNAFFPDFASSHTVSDSVTFKMGGGNDGTEPQAADFKNALDNFIPLEDVAIVTAPGSGAFGDHQQIVNSLITHVSRQRAYRIAILETPPDQDSTENEDVRSQIDSSYAALYVPWVVTPNPLAVAGSSIPSEIVVPPSGFIAGIYARNDEQKGVAKAPANEVVLGASRFERNISFAEQGVLNPIGINCLRYFPNRGYRLWGARTATSNTEFMYVNVRRYLIYLEHSIDNSTQWAVFENNGPALWAQVKESIDSFLYNEWKEGSLLGESAAQAYFVRCDRTTMTQNDLDNGRMICLIGVALLKPAEFVIFRIGQMTASAQS